MADTKISALTGIGTLHSDDLLVDVDVHDTTMAASGTDKKLTVNQLIGGATSGQLIVCNSSSVPVGATKILQGAGSQLNLSAISAPGSPVAGDTWFDSTQNCHVFFDGFVNRYSGTLVYAQKTNTTVATTSGASSLKTLTGAIGTDTFPAGALNFIGRTIRVKGGGNITTSGTPGTLCFFIKLGTNVIATGASGSPVILSVTNAPVYFTADIVVKATGSSGKLDTTGVFQLPASSATNSEYISMWFGNGTVAGTIAAGTQPTIDLTASYVFDFLCNFSNGNDTLVWTNLSVEVIG